MKDAFIYEANSTFECAVQAMDNGGKGFLAIIDQNQRLLGILTDGDVRRAFLRKQKSLDEIINKSPEVMLEPISEQEIISKLKSSLSIKLTISRPECWGISISRNTNSGCSLLIKSIP